MTDYPLNFGWHTNAKDDTDRSDSSDVATDRYPLAFGWHTDAKIGADESASPDNPKLPVFVPALPTLLGGADPASFPDVSSVTPVSTGGAAIDSDIPDSDAGFHKDGAQLAQVKPTPQPAPKNAPVRRSAIPREELTYPSATESTQMVSAFNAAHEAQQRAAREAEQTDAQRAVAAVAATYAAQQLNGYASQPLPSDWSKKPIPADWERQMSKATLASLNASAARFNVPRELLARILWQESEFGKSALNPRAQGQGSAGVSTDAITDLKDRARATENRARIAELGRLDRLKEPDAVNMAAEYVRMLYDENRQSWPAAIIAYKTGRTAAREWLNGNFPVITTDSDELGRATAYLRYVFQGDPGRFDPRSSPDVP